VVKRRCHWARCARASPLSWRHAPPHAATRCAQLDLTSSEPVSLDGLEKELAKYENHEARTRA
jgi:hypothetical protein